MKKTALNEVHKALGAKMVEFAGYEMPVSYVGINEEHHTVRNGVGMFDVSHMGEFFVTGPKALNLLQFVTSNDVSKLSPGKIQYSCLPNDDGGIVDDLLVYKLAEEEYMLVVNASNIQKDWNWISEKNKTIGAEMDNRSDEYSLFAVQGPKANQALQSLTNIDLPEMTYYTFDIGEFAGEHEVIVSATGYTGAGGFEIYVQNESAELVWDAIMKAGEAVNLQPIGLGARDTLRLEKGFALYGNDIDDTTSPIEAGLGWITKFSKDFVNSDGLAAQKEAGVTRRLVGFVLENKGIARQGYPILNADGEEVGNVTSGVMSPTLGKAIGMGYVKKGNGKEGTPLLIQVRNKQLKAVVSKPPFVK